LRELQGRGRECSRLVRGLLLGLFDVLEWSTLNLSKFLYVLLKGLVSCSKSLSFLSKRLSLSDLLLTMFVIYLNLSELIFIGSVEEIYNTVTNI